MDENAVLPHATIEGDRVTVHNVRNFAYRTETDFTPAWHDKTYDLRQLEGVDLVATYWMGPAVAHIFLSFAFAGGDHLAVSIETRKEKGEGYSTVKGFFRQYELYYVVADERDVIGLRTNYRRDPPEDVYVYRIPPRLHGLSERHQCAEGEAGVLQLAHHQLHDDDLDPFAGQPGSRAVQLEGAGQRLCAAVPVRTRAAGRRWPAVCRTSAALAGQSACAAGRRGGGLFHPHPAGSALERPQCCQKTRGQ